MTKVAMVRGIPAYLKTFVDRGGTTVVEEAMVKPEDRYIPHREVCRPDHWFKVEEGYPKHDVIIDFIGMGNYSLDLSSYTVYHYVGKFKADADGDYFETDQARFRVGDDFIKLWRYRGAPQGLS
jgi:hypothetical protein